MPVIDVHAHWVPQVFRDAIDRTGSWHGMCADDGELGLRGMRLSADERIEDMDRLGVDLQLLSPQAGFYQYHREASVAAQVALECNDEVATLVNKYPDRFMGIGTLPMQSVELASAELRRIRALGLKGAVLSDHVDGSTYEEEQYLPFWELVESTGSVVLFHQGFDHRGRVGKFHLDNSVGNLTEHTLNYGVLTAGGVVDRFPGLKLIFAHAGGFIPYAVSRMDKVAGGFGPDNPTEPQDYRAPYDALPTYASPAAKLPSEYLRNFYYDSCTYSPTTLRFLIEAVGVDRVLFGTDSPAPMVLTDGVRWIEGLEALTKDEKSRILSENAAALLSDDS